MVVSRKIRAWCCACLLACAGCAWPGSKASQSPNFVPAGSTPSLWSSLIPGRGTDLNAVNANAAKSSKTVDTDDPLSLRHMPKQLGPDVHVHAARVHESKGKLDQAHESYQEALKISPTDLGALVGVARLHDRRGNYAEATQWYQRALAAHPSCAAAHNDLGLCYAREGQVQASIDMLDQAVRLDPTQALYRNNLAKVLVEANRIDEAYSHLSAVFPPAAAHYNLGYLAREAGRPEIAVAALENSLASDPAFVRSSKLLERTRLEMAQQASFVAQQPPQQGLPPRQPPQGGQPPQGPAGYGPQGYLPAAGHQWR